LVSPGKPARQMVERRRHGCRKLAERLRVGIDEGEVIAGDHVVARHETETDQRAAATQIQRFVGREGGLGDPERLAVPLHDRIERAVGQRHEVVAGSERDLPVFVADEACSNELPGRVLRLVNGDLAHAQKVHRLVAGRVMTEVMKLSKHPFLALAAIGWADGSLQRIEAVGLLRAAKEAGLEGADLAAIETATKSKITLDDADLSGMSEWDQVLTYALAAWFAQLDGVVSTSEVSTLDALGDKFHMTEGTRKRAAAAAYDIVCLPEGGRPERYDFTKLAARLHAKLPQVEAPKD
jgi:hypothetical protein